MEMLKAIRAAKKKNDQANAEKIADSLRLSMLPECHTFQKRLVEELHTDELSHDRVERLLTTAGIGDRKAVSYCGLCSAQRESAVNEQRGSIAKKRNKHSQTIPIEAAKIAPHRNEQLAILHNGN